MPKEAVLPQLRRIEQKLMKNPDQACAYKTEIERLRNAGYVDKLQPCKAERSQESWYIPHHMVTHNGKNRVVYNCSFQYEGQNLNELLLPGHPDDKPLLRFLWRDITLEKAPDVYQWQVLPLGTTCSPCGTFTLQKHVLDHSQPGDQVREVIEKYFYVDNCLHSLTCKDATKDQLCALLNEGGFELRQWASNCPAAIARLPSDTRSNSYELWLSQGLQDTHESTLGLLWYCQSDTLPYKHRVVNCTKVTMRNIYRLLASQYDPLGYIISYTT
ncbi:Gag-Pro-Pol polyprotein [Labeo rohita]|uniref:Gag-Pro-Pol polyprotein n=1 Tax=Labeo rohita TaxID=84645 RepID=A0ABQ8L9C1_LABRO|nr:Gag-Pro-Pol polyprotein [Labeo rohita]